MVMGQFALGDPLLDGNGQIVLIVQTKLCARVNSSIEWFNSKKTDYLQTLTKELQTPDKALLDSYFGALIQG
jgi:fido (protein-threonine AMPylation protein)